MAAIVIENSSPTAVDLINAANNTTVQTIFPNSTCTIGVISSVKFKNTATGQQTGPMQLAPGNLYIKAHPAGANIVIIQLAGGTQVASV